MMLFDSRHDAIDLRSTRSTSPRRTSTENRRELRGNRGVELRLEATDRERLEPFELRIAPNRSPWPRRISIEHRRELRWNRGVELHLEAIDRERLEPFELRIAPNRSPWPRRGSTRSTSPRRMSSEKPRELRWNRAVELRPEAIDPLCDAAIVFVERIQF